MTPRKAQSISAMLESYNSVSGSMKNDHKRDYLRELASAAAPYTDAEVHKVCERFRLGHVPECLQYPPTVPQWLVTARKLIVPVTDYKKREASQRASKLIPEASWKPPSAEARARVKKIHEKFKADTAAQRAQQDLQAAERERRREENQIRANKHNNGEAQARASLLKTLEGGPTPSDV